MHLDVHGILGTRRVRFPWPSGRLHVPARPPLHSYTIIIPRYRISISLHSSFDCYKNANVCGRYYAITGQNAYTAIYLASSVDVTPLEGAVLLT